MTLQEIKQISIRKYLKNLGIYPVNNRDYYGMYYCPYREDRNASFKVDYSKNLWHDFGTGEGGSIIDLVMKLENCLLAEALRKLDDSFSFHRNNSTFSAMISKCKDKPMKKIFTVWNNNSDITTL